MKTKVLFISLLLVLGSCKNEQRLDKESQKNSETEIGEHGEKHWSYQGETGPEHWAELEKDSDCGGMYQSPINIVNYSTNTSLTPIEVHYTKDTKIHDVTNNGHSIQYNFDPGDYIVLNDDTYVLKQFHFHEPAEHTIDGVRYPLVLHLVHVGKEGKYAVLAVMAKEGESSEPFEFLEHYLPLKEGETKIVDRSFDMNYNLPQQRGYYAYMGSLTTPPCTEGVQWLIYKEPITVSLAQVEALQKVMPLNNYRNLQPHNGREISASK